MRRNRAAAAIAVALVAIAVRDSVITIPGSSGLAVDARTSGGSATNDFGLPVTQAGGVASFAGTIGDGSDGSLSIVTSGGDVRLSRAL